MPLSWRPKTIRVFRKYILDQDVIESTSKQGGATVWTSMADALLKAEPDRYEIVNTLERF